MTADLLRAEAVALDLGGQEVLRDVSLNLRAGEFVSVVGPSGCGKSSLLLLLAGLVKPTRGRIFYRGVPVVGPSRRRALIFQNHALFPWLTARENIRFAAEDENQVDYFLRQVGLSAFAEYYPYQMSGGMQQRIGIARALAAQPDLILLDEPFASLDLVHRQALSGELLRLARELNKTMIFVTHSIDEAIHLGDRIYLMKKGTIHQELTVAPGRPEKFLDFRASDEFLRVERAVHEHLFGISMEGV